MRGFDIVRSRRRGAADDGGRRTAVASNGFTLIEMMVVMMVIVVLAGISLAVYGTSTHRAREAALKQNLFQMRDAIDQYYADRNRYPPTLDALVSERYLRQIPVDPFTNSADTWQTEMAEFDATNPQSEPGIYDVKSGSDRLATDGSRYVDW
jgi:general secretion pathway protein G